MNWELFDKIYVDVSNGCSKKEMIKRYGVDVIKEYEEWGDEIISELNKKESIIKVMKDGCEIRKHLQNIAEDESMETHNMYLMDDLRTQIETIDDWLNGTAGTFDKTNFKHICKLAIIVDINGKLENLIEQMEL